MTATLLDQAHAAMQADPENDVARLQFYEALADAELWLLLEGEAQDDSISPRTLSVDDVTYTLVFDQGDRAADHAGGVAETASLPGRALVQMLAGQGVGLALNPGVATSDMLIPPDAVDWLVSTLAHAPEEAEARLIEVRPPSGLPASVIEAIDRKLLRTAGLAEVAWLVAATYEGGGQGHVLAFVDASPGAEPALAHTAGEALTFSGIEAGVLDVMFLSNTEPAADKIARVGLRFDLPKLAETPGPIAPGSDPDRPPKLR